VRRLRPAWRFAFTIAPRDSGVVTATPVVSDGVVYIQDMESNVFALDSADGNVIWRHLFHAGTPGPNGVAIDRGTVFGSTDTTVFALVAKTGEVRWTRRILGDHESFVDVAPLAHGGLVYTATTGYGPGTRPAIYALDASTGEVRWRFQTIRDPWRHPDEAGGGGVWQTPTLSEGTLYAGTANPLPWGGSPARPNGGAYPGRTLYTDSLVALDAGDGRLKWFDQVTPHDIRDHDFESPPIVAGRLVVGSGKGGQVVAWDRDRRTRVWRAEVGVHRNDRGPLPAHSVAVCPGLLGGVETPGSTSRGRSFFAVVELCHTESATGAAAHSFASADPRRGRGEVVALDTKTGSRLWTAPLSSPPFGCTTVANDVVFATTYDGQIIGFDVANGSVVWRAHARAGINACPSIVGNSLYVAAGTQTTRMLHPRYELVAYRLTG
jgi:alcohol dehydrogenase (cytochrome c)